MQNKNNGIIDIITEGEGVYLLKRVGLPALNQSIISSLYAGPESDFTDQAHPYPKYIVVNEGNFSYHHAPDIHVDVRQDQEGLSVKCTCSASLRAICQHQIQVLLRLIQ